MDFKYNEGRVLDALRAYIESTYGGHYVEGKNIQLIDLYEQMGDAEAFFKTNVLKYVYRYGRKEGKRNERDIMKALHYLVLLYNLHHSDQLPVPASPPAPGGYTGLQRSIDWSKLTAAQGLQVQSDTKTYMINGNGLVPTEG